MKIKVIKSKEPKEILPQNFEIGKLYNFKMRGEKDHGVILIVTDDNSKFGYRIVELSNTISSFLWGDKPIFKDFVFTEFEEKLEISN